MPFRTPPRRPLTGRVVLVTGVVAGIGREVVRLLDAADAVIVGVDRDADRLSAVQREMPRLDLHQADVSDAGDRAALVARVLAAHGRVDALVNNAGLGWTGLVEEMTLEDLEQLYATNLVAFADLVRLLLPQMLERRDGDVLVISSGAAWVSTPPLTVYSSTKFGVEGFVEGLRREVWRRGVRVHSVNPGPVRTEWLSRSRGYEPREDDPAAPPSPGVPAEWVARAVGRSLTRGYPGYVSVPRPVGLGRLLRLQPLRGLADLGLGLAAGRLGALGRAAAERRTP